ncbi:MAG: ABC transporter substrate-binding protein [Alphaproteobacteria bacterium]
MDRTGSDKKTRLTLSDGLSRRGFLETVGGLSAVGSLMVIMPSALRAQEAGEPVKVGVMGPFTGPSSRTGDAIRAGAMMAFEDARAGGEVPVTIDGRKHDIEIVWVDSQSSPEKAVKAVTDAVNRQGAQVMVTGWHSSVAMAVMDAEAPLKLVHIGHLGESQYISEKINKDPEKYAGWFKGWPSPPIFAGLYGEPLRYFIDNGLWTPATKTAAVLVEDTDYGRGWGEALMNSLKQAGFDPLPYDVTALDETEFSPLIAKYKAQRVSVVGMTTTGSVSASNFVKQFRSQRVKALVISHGLTWFSEWYELTGDASDFIVTMDSPRIMAPFQQAWVDRYEAKYGEEPSIAASGHPYDYMRLAIRVLNQAGTLDFDTLAGTTREIEHEGVWQYYKFSKEPGPNALAPNEVMTGRFMEGFFFPMVQLKKGQGKILWPLEYAEQEFKQPPWI